MSAQTEARERTESAVKARKAEKVDYKMVTFSLAGKEYGIDIMSVKEIAKASRFTYVPNALPFVRGVYNLRGDIISVIDMRIFFHLPAERKEDEALESLIILQVGEHAFGVIVDGIDKVIGIASESIQPPHPIFGDINVKYIKGIVENGGKLYIILDVERIFSPERVKEEEAEEAAAALRAGAEDRAEAKSAPEAVTGGEIAASFVKETLATFRGFHVGPVNEAWFAARFAEWKAGRTGQDLQIKESAEADAFLEGYWSPSTGRLWDRDYAEAVESILPDVESKSINVWNPGCGKGYETWSLACVLRKRYPEVRIKIWANDSDLLAISMAPNMVFPDAVPDYYEGFMGQGRNGLAFSPKIRDSIFFEYHDVLNANPLPPLDMILCRDMLSFLAPIDQKRLFGDFNEKLKPSGIVLVGVNERLGEGWTPLGSGTVPAFRKG